MQARTSNQSSELRTPLSDGSRVLIRPICAYDTARHAKFIDGLSSTSKHLLFLGGITRLSEPELQRLCHPDYADDMAYVALTEGPDPEQIGVARYAMSDDPDRGAEISVAVADRWQRKGLATLLLERLIEHAAAHGIRRLFSIDSAANQPMQKLAARFGFSVRRDPEDAHQVVCSLSLPGTGQGTANDEPGGEPGPAP